LIPAGGANRPRDGLGKVPSAAWIKLGNRPGHALSHGDLKPITTMNANSFRNNFARLSLGLVALAGLAALPACRTVVVDEPSNTVGRVKLGELQVFANHDFETTYRAAKQGIADRKLFLTQDDKKYAEAELRARDSVDTLIIVKIKEVARDRTSVKVRYGVSGDTANAQLLYNDIARRY
jgi:hypothetical protein